MDDDSKKQGPRGPRRPSGTTGDGGRSRPQGERSGSGGFKARSSGPRADGPRSDGPRPPRRDGEGGARKFGGGGPRTGGRSRGDAPRSNGPRADGARPPRRDGEGGDRKFGGGKPRGEGGGFRDRDGKPGRSFGSRDGKPGGERRGSGHGSDRAPRVDVVVKPTRRVARDDVVSGETGEVTSERIAKRLARAGISSRRDAEMLISQGRVKVNGAILATPARDVTAADRIEVDGKEIPPIERTRLFLFHKPAGVVTTNRDPEGRKTVFDELPKGLPRLITIGRLDINTEGLLLLTNDGGLARMLELPSTGWMRRYRVRVHGKVDEARLAALKDGIAVDGVFYGAVEASLEREQGTNAWINIALREGKNREVKNILGALGLEVARLIRISYGPFQLAELEPSHVMEINGRTLRDQLGERLVEESGANFDADIVKPFSNKPVHRRDQPETNEARPARTQREVTVGEGGLVRGYRKDRERAREDMRDRWTTNPNDRGFGDRDGERGARGRPVDGERRSGPPRDRSGPRPAGRGPSRRDEGDDHQPENARTANVWRAPGAKPQGRRPSERAAAKREAERSEGTGRPQGRSDGRPGGGFRGRPSGDRPEGSRPRPAGDRPSRPAGDRPPRPAGDRPPRPTGDRPARPFGDRPGGGRPGGGKAGGRPPRKG